MPVHGIAYEMRGRSNTRHVDDFVKCRGCGDRAIVTLVEVVRANDWPVCDTPGCPERGQVMEMTEPAEATR